MKIVRHTLIGLIASLASPAVYAADTYYSIKTIGLTDAEWNSPAYINNSGYVAGRASSGWTSQGDYLGYYAWVYDGSSTKQIGLMDATHTDANTGATWNFISSLSTNSSVFGVAARFAGATDIGSSAWVYNGNTTQEIGLIDAAHTNLDTGYRYTDVYIENANGMTIGNNQLYNGSAA